MGRTAVSDTKKKTSAVKGVIVQYMNLRNATDEDMAEKLGISERTFLRKMDDPGKFTVEQLAIMSNALQIPQRVNFFIGASPPEENVDRIAMAIVMALQKMEGRR